MEWSATMDVNLFNAAMRLSDSKPSWKDRDPNHRCPAEHRVKDEHETEQEEDERRPDP